jgi:hypothetical protein
MAYTPTVWQAGDIVSSTKLNKLENAVKDVSDAAEDIATKVTITVDEGTGEETFDVKAKSLYDALKTKVVYVVRTVGDVTFINNGIMAAYDTNHGYQFFVREWDNETGAITKAYAAATDDDYPSSGD